MTGTDSESKEQIVSLEKRLLKAFCDFDVVTLDELIHNDALFILPNAQTIPKSTVLDNYRQKKMDMEITPGDHVVTLIGDTAVMSISLESLVTMGETKSRSQFRYMRVWKLVNGTWKIIATSGTQLK